MHDLVFIVYVWPASLSSAGLHLWNSIPVNQGRIYGGPGPRPPTNRGPPTKPLTFESVHVFKCVGRHDLTYK